MLRIEIPYGKGFMAAEIDEQNMEAVLQPSAHHFKREASETSLIERALDHPINSAPLEKLVIGKSNMVIITSDHTRPVPSDRTLPILLRRIRSVNPGIVIKILIATGFHRPTTKEEMLDKFGEGIVANEILINHDSQKKEDLICVGKLPSGGELWLNKLTLETDLLIAEGFIEPHFFAGFSGGRKSILPGVAGAATIMWNHNAQFIRNNHARTGILQNNPIHEDMLYAAEKANLQFILNVVIDKEKRVIHAVSGHSRLAHEDGCKFAAKLSEIEKVVGDIVITSNGGYPLDQNIYQSVKGMTAAEACCKDKAIIIMVSACNDGHGGESFYRNMAQAESPQVVLDRVLKLSMDQTEPDQWEFQILARILCRYKVIMVTDRCDPGIIKKMHMEHAFTLKEALERAFKLKGSDAKVVVIPDGVSVVVK